MDDLKTGIKEAKRGNTRLGMELLNDFSMHDHFPEAKAWFGYCLAYEKNDISRGISLCKEALSSNSGLPEGYLALARIYLHKGYRKKAVDVLRQGMKTRPNEEISCLLTSIGIRRKPIVPFWGRDNFFNVLLGRILTSIRLR